MRYAPYFCGVILAACMVLAVVMFSDYSRDTANKFEEARLQLAVNYAVDAASLEMKKSSANLGQDYTTIGKMNVDPTVAMDVFSCMMCKNYDIPVTTVNQQNFMLSYCPLFVVATYDGYYVADRVKINDAGVENMIFSPKLPYTYVHTEADGSQSLYSVNMAKRTSIKIDAMGNLYNVNGLPISKEEQSAVINDTLTEVLNEQLNKYASQDPRGKIYLPSEFRGLRSTNPVNNITVFAYIDNFDVLGYGQDLQSFGIGGSEIKQGEVVVGFTVVEAGRTMRYYTYSDKLPTTAEEPTIHVVDTFDTQAEAAENGFYYYVK